MKGRGLKAAVRKTQSTISEYNFVFRSDIDSYYASIDHDVLLDLVSEFVSDPIVMNLIAQSLKRTETWGGNFWDFKRGIPLGSPLSPLLGALALLPLDRALTREGCFYARYMDDWIVLTKTQSQLRKVAKITNKILATLKQTKHPDKTFVGRISKGFDFLGYRFNGLVLKPAKVTIERALAKMTLLYEQKALPPEREKRLADYARRWVRWIRAGVPLDDSLATLVGGLLVPIARFVP